MPLDIHSLSGLTRICICEMHWYLPESDSAAILMTERQILFDPINIRWPKDFGLPQRPPALGVFAFHQMAFAGAPEKNFAGAGYLETFFY
jgi:hypothetical protein